MATVTSNEYEVSKKLGLVRQQIRPREIMFDVTATSGRGAWINVEVRQRGGYATTFGYDTTARRWSYGNAPAAPFLAAALQAIKSPEQPAPTYRNEHAQGHYAHYLPTGELWLDE